MLMKYIKSLLSCFALVGVAMAGAQDFSTVTSMQPGQVLGQDQFEALGKLASVQIDGKTYWVVPVQAGEAGTTVLDSGRRVGKTANQVSIVEQSTEKVRTQLAGPLTKASSVKYYDHMNITLVRYSTIQQAVQGLTDIRAAMPGALIGLPISFSQSRIQ